MSRHGPALVKQFNLIKFKKIFFFLDSFYKIFLLKIIKKIIKKNLKKIESSLISVKVLIKKT